MSRKLLIFGNGLGMALDRNHFSLVNALSEIWDRNGILTDEQKDLICRCTGKEIAPEGEHELDKLHLAVSSCDTLNQIGGGRVHWLSDDGQNFPAMTAKYIHKVATKLHNYDGSLSEDFIQPLIEYVKDTKSHVATLNYDKLLYSAFIENDVFKGGYYYASLIDGMLDSGFDSDSLVRQYSNTFGYYLHLHGSPLFINRNNLKNVIKLPRHELTLEDERIGRHIVLTHVEHKPAVIASSYVLSTYWDYLRFCLSEADEIVLFGYSGFDTHLNSLIKPFLGTKTCKVVEWSGAGEKRERLNFWNSKLGTTPNLKRLDSILDYTSW